MDYKFTKEMLSVDLKNEDALYALLGLPISNEDCLEIIVEITLSDIRFEYNDGKSWHIDGQSEGYIVTGYDKKIEAICGEKRVSLENVLVDYEEKDLLEDAEEAAIKELMIGE